MAINGSKTAIYFVIFISKQSLLRLLKTINFCSIKLIKNKKKQFLQRILQEIILKIMILRADSGQLQFWSEPSKILNVRSSSTPERL